MTALVLPVEVVEHAGGALPVSVTDEAIIAAQVALYQAELEAILGRGVTKEARVDTLPLPLAGSYWRARRGPVHEISGIEAGGVPLSTTYYARNRNGAELWGGTYGTYVEGTDLVVSYVGGWDAPDNQPAKSAVLGRTARWWNKRADDDVGTESSSVEGHAVKWMPDAFTVAELNACERLRAPDLVG